MFKTSNIGLEECGLTTKILKQVTFTQTHRNTKEYMRELISLRLLYMTTR